PRLRGRVRQPLRHVAGRPVREPGLRPHLHMGRSAHRLRDPGGVTVDERTATLVPETQAQSPVGLVVPPERRLLAVSPINRRRWENFKNNRRGFWSLWIFLGLFLIAMSANFIANDKPFLVKYDGHYFFPVLFDYSQADFGVTDELGESSADFRD